MGAEDNIDDCKRVSPTGSTGYVRSARLGLVKISLH